MTDTHENAVDPLGPELIVGLVTPLGTNTADVAERVRAALASWSYRSHIIKVTDFFNMRAGDTPADEYEDERVRRLIDAGNAWCHRYNDAAAVARVAILLTRQTRQALNQADGGVRDDEAELSTPVPRHAYILHSLKRIAEVELLRQVYGEQFLLVACQASRDARIETLASRPLSNPDDKLRRSIAVDLMELDGAEDDPMGQNVNETFPRADYFLGVDESADRFMKLVFGDAQVAPQASELAMYLAQATSLQSLSSSRRVGATLAKGGSIIAVGCNEVPIEETPDILTGVDFSESIKTELLGSTLRMLRSKGWLAPDKVALSDDQLVENGRLDLNDSQLMDVIEYQRAVHAEVAAISDAARRGQPTEASWLYCTTYPCHLCFKSALAAGIDRVLYIEPYSKSRAAEMFPDSGARLIPYEGVAPRTYVRFFEARQLGGADETGRYQPRDRAVAVPVFVWAVDPERVAREEANAVANLNLNGGLA